MTYEQNGKEFFDRFAKRGRYLATSFDQWTHHQGVPVSPNAYSELEQMQAMGHEYDYLKAAVSCLVLCMIEKAYMRD